MALVLFLLFRPGGLDDAGLPVQVDCGGVDLDALRRAVGRLHVVVVVGEGDLQSRDRKGPDEGLDDRGHRRRRGKHRSAGAQGCRC